MLQPVDPKNLLSTMHFQARGELMRLMDGFYSNIEDGLFEHAFNNDSADQQRQTVELMRELRFRREHLLKTFGKRMKNAVQAWFGDDQTRLPRRMTPCRASSGALQRSLRVSAAGDRRTRSASGRLRYGPQIGSCEP